MLSQIALYLDPSQHSSYGMEKSLEICQRLKIKQTLKPYTTPYTLYWDQQGLRLCQWLKRKSQTLLYIDFIHGKNGYRHAHDCTINQPLARAVGIKSGFRPTIFDATAGLGGDAFVLASLGCSLQLCERSPLLYTLLEDGLYRANNHPETAKIVSRMQLLAGNSIAMVEAAKEVHTIYMDPMYPHKKKSALNKQEMRIIRDFVGDDNDADALFHAAREIATNRVVVKRPKGAPHVAELQPSHEIIMKNSRFDVYLHAHL